MMADVHFVVGPPGGTQRVPGHKVTQTLDSFRAQKILLSTTSSLLRQLYQL